MVVGCNLGDVGEFGIDVLGIGGCIFLELVKLGVCCG